MVGDIVIAPVPYTDLRGRKNRPVVLVADVGLGDWIVCPITTQGSGQGERLALDGEDMRGAGLRARSWVRTNRLYSLNESVFRSAAGRLTDAMMADIRTAIRSLFP